MPDETIETVTVSEAMELLGKSDKSIRNYIERGRLSAEMGSDRKLHIPKSEVLQLARHPAQIQVDKLEKVTKEVEDLKAQLATVEHLLETLTTRLEALTSSPVVQTPTTISQPRRTQPQRQQTDAAAGSAPAGNVPPGYVIFPRDFSHGIPDTTAKNNIGNGYTVTPGVWKVGRHNVTRLLSPEQQREYYLHWHTNPQFKTCPLCPHEVIAEEE